MRRTLRRKDRELNIADAKKLLEKCEYGFLATADNSGQAYVAPLHYAYKNNNIYFHCALDGHKLDNIKENNKVSFCVVGSTKVLPDKFATEYESVVVFGMASEVSGNEKYEALLSLLEKYSPGFIKKGKDYIAKDGEKTKVIKIDINFITGKAKR